MTDPTNAVAPTAAPSAPAPAPAPAPATQVVQPQDSVASGGGGSAQDSTATGSPTGDVVGNALDVAFGQAGGGNPTREEILAQIAGREFEGEDGDLEASLDGLDAEGGAEGVAQPPADGKADAAAQVGEPPEGSVLGEGGQRAVVRDAQGKFVPAPDVRLEFTVGEKTYQKSLSELVRMARDGVAGQQYVEDARQYRQVVPKFQERLKQLESQLESQAELNRTLLDDEAAYYDVRDEWLRRNTPEEKLRRIEAEQAQQAQQARAQEEQARVQGAVTQYYTREIKPAQDHLLNAPEYEAVTLEAKLGKITMDTLPLMRNGVVPPDRLPDYRAYLLGPFREWLEAESARIKQAEKAREEKLSESLRRGAQAAQSRVQAVGRQLSPSGRPGPSSTATELPPPATREEAKRRIIEREWQG